MQATSQRSWTPAEDDYEGVAMSSASLDETNEDTSPSASATGGARARSSEEIRAARAVRNREAAHRSRMQQKEKRSRLENENDDLKRRLEVLESEHRDLVRRHTEKFGRDPPEDLTSAD